MADDLNTPNAYMVIYDTVKLLNQSLRQKEINWSEVYKYYNTINKMLEILGIFIKKVTLTDEDKDLYNKMNEAKANKYYEKANMTELNKVKDLWITVKKKPLKKH